jgi:hypothetical protein
MIWNWSNIASEAGFYPKISIDGKYIAARQQASPSTPQIYKSQFKLHLGG